MPPIRSRAAGLAAALSLTLAVAAGTPVFAADDPEAAARALLEAVEAGAYEDLESLICEAEREMVIQSLDPGEAMGFDGAREMLTFAYEDVGIELVSEDGDSATVKITGTMSMETGDMPVEEIARALLEADMGEVSEEDLEMMLPFLEMALTQTMPLDSELTVVREDGEWVVCGGLGEEPAAEDDFDDLFEDVAEVPAEGLCGLVSPEDLSAVGPLDYEISSGWVVNECSYQDSNYTHSTTVKVELDKDAAYAAGAIGYDVEVEAAGAPAFTSEQSGAPLLAQVGPDMLTVQVQLWDAESVPDGYDRVEQSTAIAELFAPRVTESRGELVLPVPPLLCDLTFAGDLEAAFGMPVHSGSVSAESCNYESREDFYVNVYVSQGTVEQYAQFTAGAEETTIAGQPALVSTDLYDEGSFNVMAELPGEQLLTIDVRPAAYDRPMSVDGVAVAELLAQHILDKLPE